MRHFSLAAALALGGLAAMTGCAPTPLGDASAPIIGGTVDTTDNGVVLLIQGSFGGTEVTLCSAEVIAPHVLLTAAHCLIQQDAQVTPVFSVVLDERLNGQGITDGPKVASVHPHPLYSSKVFGTNDLGVVILASPVPVPPLPYNTQPLDAALDGSMVRLIGYGVTSGTDTTAATADERHQTTSTLNSIAQYTISVGSADHNDCEGDSGGPALLSINGTEQIIGLTSYGSKGCGTPTTDVRVDAYAESFITPYVNLAENNGGSTVGPGEYLLGETGAPCLLNDDCDSQLCANAGNHGFCTSPCDASHPCPASTHCGAAGGGEYCLSDALPKSGCSMGSVGGRPSWAWMLGAMMMLWLVRRRRAGA